jgi:hypothetical protein
MRTQPPHTALRAFTPSLFLLRTHSLAGATPPSRHRILADEAAPVRLVAEKVSLTVELSFGTFAQLAKFVTPLALVRIFAVHMIPCLGLPARRTLPGPACGLVKRIADSLKTARTARQGVPVFTQGRREKSKDVLSPF